MKFSEDEDKATYPGNKTIYRVWTEANAAAKFDLIRYTLANEVLRVNISRIA